jgi:hypothetical protein
MKLVHVLCNKYAFIVFEETHANFIRNIAEKKFWEYEYYAIFSGGFIEAYGAPFHLKFMHKCKI